MLQSLLNCSLCRHILASFKPASLSPDGSVATALHNTATIQAHLFPRWANGSYSPMQQFTLSGQARQPIHMGLTTVNHQYQRYGVVGYCSAERGARPASCQAHLPDIFPFLSFYPSSLCLHLYHVAQQNWNG